MQFRRALASIFLPLSLCAAFALCGAPAVAASAQASATPSRSEIAAADAFASRQAAAGQMLLGSAVPFANFDGKPAIAAFYAQPFILPGDTQSHTRAVGYIFLDAGALPESAQSAGARSTRKVLIGSFEPEGDTPAIAAIFLMNPEVSAKRLFGVLVDYNVNHRDTVQGTLHETFVFDASDAALAGKQLPLMKALSHKVDGGCECDYGKGVEFVKFKTADKVRAGLRALGY